MILGPMILGHRNSIVEKTVKKYMKNGYTFGASTKGEIIMAELVCDAFPGMDKVLEAAEKFYGFVNAGSKK